MGRILVVFLLVLTIVLPNVECLDPRQFKSFLVQNTMQQCASRPEEPKMPRSFYVPSTYFDGIPLDERVSPAQKYSLPTKVPPCDQKLVSPKAMDAYTFESERFLTTLGLNIYDGAVYSIALALLGDIPSAINYETSFISQSATCQFKNTRGDAYCRGLIVTGQCNDTNQSGYCGFCYNGKTETQVNSWSFRLLSDYWGLQGTVDMRCPELGHQWTWNDYRPVLGENAWASFTGPLQVALMKFGQAGSIPDNDVSMSIALNFLASLQNMMSPIGGIYYAPKNTVIISTSNVPHDFGFDISVENNISLMAGLKALKYILMQKKYRTDLIPMIDSLITNITGFVQQSYDPALGYFRQGGSYNPQTNAWAWATGPNAFAVDCQTWTLSVLGPRQVDAWFGAGTSVAIWETTKKIGGYHYMFDGSIDGLGFTYNSNDQVFSGEWTLGGINMLRIFATELQNSTFGTEADSLRLNIQSSLTETDTINNIPVTGVRYANKRYYIPFGWWANPLLSQASTSWAVLVDSNFNPFYLGGAYKINY